MSRVRRGRARERASARGKTAGSKARVRRTSTRNLNSKTLNDLHEFVREGITKETLKINKYMAQPPRLKKRKMRKQIAALALDGVAYRFANGLRHVVPYDYVYATHAKERWYGRTVLDVFTCEFGDRTPA